MAEQNPPAERPERYSSMHLPCIWLLIFMPWIIYFDPSIPMEYANTHGMYCYNLCVIMHKNHCHCIVVWQYFIWFVYTTHRPSDWQVPVPMVHQITLGAQLKSIRWADWPIKTFPILGENWDYLQKSSSCRLNCYVFGIIKKLFEVAREWCLFHAAILNTCGIIQVTNMEILVHRFHQSSVHVEPLCHNQWAQYSIFTPKGILRC